MQYIDKSAYRQICLGKLISKRCRGYFALFNALERDIYAHPFTERPAVGHTGGEGGERGRERETIPSPLVNKTAILQPHNIQC